MALLQVHNNNEHEIMLNTPNRNEILKEGPPLNAKYNILGRGAYGTVFKAIFRAQPVAVKIMRNVNKTNAQALRNESNILGWKHRNIVRTFKIESTPSFGIVIMERFMGQSLQTILETMSLPLEHRIFITLDILSALSYCHTRQLLHLDVKPQNILVSFGAAAAVTTTTAKPFLATTATNKLRAERLIARSHGRQYICKLCDFGASTKLSSAETLKQTAAAATTKGSARGTVRYMSPEALREQPLTAAADIYSLGVTMWQLQQRRLPYNWIECNEVVAYQVVKHNLRPDASVATLTLAHCSRAFTNGSASAASSSSSSNASTAHLCSCSYKKASAATTAAEITCRSLEHITHLLNYSKAPAEQLHFSDCSVQRTPQLLGERCRRPFQDLSAKMNVLRDLRAEWDVKQPLTALPLPMNQRLLKQPDCGSGGGSEQQHLLTLFANVLRVQDRSKECRYEALYSSCWQSAAPLRPSASELRRRLLLLL